MDRNQAKELLPIIQAYAEGKSIEFSSITDVSKAWREVTDFPLGMIGRFKFRIKPEPKYRPFANAEECWAEMLKHQPFGWYKDKDGDFFMVSAVSNQGLHSLQAMFENGDAFVDGFPFGVKVEE